MIFQGCFTVLARATAVLAVLGGATCWSPGPAFASPVGTPSVVRAASSKPADMKFNTFVSDFRQTAIDAGIRPDIYDVSMSGIARNPRVESLNLQQPEFVKPIWSYLDSAVSEDRVAKGQQMLDTYASVLKSIENKYSVSKEILVAIWGIESNYGSAMGNFNMFEALATLAYDGPRQDFGKRELLAALKMEQEEGLSPSQMTSSWAGAFGNTQFVPSSFLSHAVDGDGDGKRDLWHSPADALASTAVLLANAGWMGNTPRYVEVMLPSGFPYELADSDSVKSVAEWKRLGVTRVNGAEFPASATGAAIYLPAGARGPAFMTFDNFRTVLKYNNAATYALAVCYLANRINGGAPITTPWPRDEKPLTADQRTQFQSDLKTLAYDPGVIDGVLGRKVKSALRLYQKAHGLPADGFPTVEMLGRLNADINSR